VHAAAVALGGRVAILIAPSGTGKSTLTFALMQSGFEYLSDELAPIDLPRLSVHPYPRALCLKSAPPRPSRVPPGTLDTRDRLYVPVESLAEGSHTAALPLALCILLERRDPDRGPVLRTISSASAAERLMSNALNTGAHDAHKLDAAVQFGRALPSFVLNSTNLRAACRAKRAISASRHACCHERCLARVHPRGDQERDALDAAARLGWAVLRSQRSRTGEACSQIQATLAA
jgi:hypothetical protein